MKSLVKKPMADKVLRANGYGAALEGKFIKRVSSAIYVTDDRWIVVTVDTLLAALYKYFRVLKFEKTHVVEVAGFELDLPGTGEYQRFGGTEEDPHVVLPVFLLEVEKIEPIQTGTELYGRLRTECKSARAIWSDADVKNIYLNPEFGTIEGEKAAQYWAALWKIKSFTTAIPLMRAIAKFSPFCIPNLYVDSFGLSPEGNLIPHHAIHSLGVHAALSKEKLYPQNKEQ